VPLPAFGQQKTSSAEATYVSHEKKGPNNPGYCDFKEVDLGFMKVFDTCQSSEAREEMY